MSELIITYFPTVSSPDFMRCTLCGALVHRLDTDIHTRWHEALDAASRTELAVRSTGMRGSDRSPGHRMCTDPSCMDDTPHVAHG